MSQQDMETQDIRQQLINELPESCRGVGKNFFDCVESTVQELNLSANTTYDEMETIINQKVIPVCIEKYDIEKCLESNSK